MVHRATTANQRPWSCATAQPGSTVDPADAARGEAIIYRGKHFSLDITAEGRKTRAPQKFPIAPQCDELQGYLF